MIPYSAGTMILYDLIKSNANAPSIVGIAKKNENSAAARFSTFNSIAPIRVEPDRDIPGIIARH